MYCCVYQMHCVRDHMQVYRYVVTVSDIKVLSRAFNRNDFH